MTSNVSRSFTMVAAAVALAACYRGVTVSSPKPTTSSPSSAVGGGAAMTVTAGMPAGVTQAMIDSGKMLFSAASCARCHGAGGAGGQNGPNLTDATWVQIDGSYDAIVKTITTGVPKANIKGKYPFAMRPMGGGTFSDEQVRAIAAYVYAISHK